MSLYCNLNVFLLMSFFRLRNIKNKCVTVCYLSKTSWQLELKPAQFIATVYCISYLFVFGMGDLTYDPSSDF